jgi:C4-dicarboxylate-specific signal transduction histidine kinase
MVIRPTSFLGKKKPRLTLALAGSLASAVFIIDAFGHTASAIMVIYGIVVMLAATVFSRRGTIVVAASCVIATMVGYVVGHLDERSVPAIARASVAIFSIIATTILTLKIQKDSIILTEQVRKLNETNEALRISTAELAHATRVTMLGELAASIAHEVTQPISAITTAGEAGLRWLKRDDPNVHEGCLAIEAMVDSARRAANIISRIRALARRSSPAFAPCKINALVVESLELLGFEIDKYGAAVELELTPADLTINGDRIQLQQVLVNLAVNGLQAMSSVSDRPRILHIKTVPCGDDQVIVLVEDSGAGVAPDMISKLFASFQTTKTDGMGIGLSICRSIIEGHGGSITCASSSSAGTEMRIELPTLARVDACTT